MFDHSSGKQEAEAAIVVRIDGEKDERPMASSPMRSTRRWEGMAGLSFETPNR